MSATQAMCNQAKVDFLNGIHQPTDVYKIALYTSAATLSKATTAYTSVGEVTGAGYTAGGMVIDNPYTVALSGDIAYVDFTGSNPDPTWSNVTLNGVEAALIYNSSKSNKALAVFTWTPATTVTAGGTFLAELPPTSPASGALIRIT